MKLTFNPALVQETAVAVPSHGTVAVRFIATFSSRAAYEQARDENVAVEMWTDLPIDSSENGWHALRFQYPEDSAVLNGDDEEAASKTLVLAPLTAQSPDRDTVELSLVLRNVRPGSRYSFTYRIVDASGGILWLGTYGKNGVLVFEDRDERLQWADQWKLNGSEAIKQVAHASEAVQIEKVASLNRDIHWTRWAFGEVGWPTLSDTYATSPCKAVFLLPRQAPSTISTIVLQPLLINAPAEGASISIDGMGHIFAGNTQSVLVHTLEPEDVAYALRSVLPENARVLDIVSETGYVAVATPSAQDTLFPVALSLIPSELREGTHAVTVNSKDVLGMVPSVQSPEVVLVNPAVQAFSFINGNTPEDITFQVGSSGGQLLLSPLHTIPATEETSWKLATLSPTLSAAVIEVPVEELSPALPTPPPSPPPVLSGSRTPGMMPQLISVPSFQSFHSLAESESTDTDPEPAEPATPLTPTSPDQVPKQLSDEEREESKPKGHSESELEPEPAFQPVVPRQVSIQEGFLRFVFTWMLRALFVRVWGLMDTSARWLGFQSLFRLAFLDGRRLDGIHSQRKKITAGSAAAAKHVDEVKDVSSVTTREEDKSVSPPDEGDVAQSSADDVDDVDDADDKSGVEPEDTQITTTTETAVPAETVPLVAPKPEPVTFAPSPIQPLRPRTKPRFLADIQSNIVSFLVHAPNLRSKLSDLAISINEKPVQGYDGEGYTCKQLTADVYILGLPGSDGESKVEVEIEPKADCD